MERCEYLNSKFARKCPCRLYYNYNVTTVIIINYLQSCNNTVTVYSSLLSCVNSYRLQFVSFRSSIVTDSRFILIPSITTNRNLTLSHVKHDWSFLWSGEAASLFCRQSTTWTISAIATSAMWKNGTGGRSRRRFNRDAKGVAAGGEMRRGCPLPIGPVGLGERRKRPKWEFWFLGYFLCQKHNVYAAILRNLSRFLN